MANTWKDDYIIEQFRLEDKDFKKYCDLITGAFLSDEAAQIEGASIVFTEETFHTVFGAPSIDKDLFIRAIYKPTDEIVGFLGSIAKNLRIDDKTYKTAIPGWLAVKKDHQRQGIAKEMGKKMFENAQERGYEGGFAFHETVQRGIDTSSSVARELSISLQNLVCMEQFVIRVYNPESVAKVIKIKWYEKLFFHLKKRISKVKSNRVRLYQPEDLEQIYKLTTDLVNKSHVSILPVYEDIEWMLGNPNVLCTVHTDENGKINGYILAWEFDFAGFGNTIPFGWLDTIHTYNLNNNEIRELANFTGLQSVKKGWKGLQTPYIPYFDAKPFKKANFIFFPKTIRIDLFNWSKIQIPEKVESLYFLWR